MRNFIFIVFIIGATSLSSVNMNLAVDYLNMEWMVDGPNIWNSYTDTNDPHQGYTEAHPCDWVDSIADTLYGMPYHYGGKDSFNQWNNDYVNGTNGPGAHTVHYQRDPPTSRDWAAGIDCSGFVGRCWGISEVSIVNFGCGHIRDNYPNIAPQLVQTGDAFVSSTHAILCYGRNEDDPNNQWVEVIEAMSDGVNKVEKNTYRIEDMIAGGFGCYSYTDSTNIAADSVSGTWTLEDGPYLINGDIQIDSTETLTIEPGVNVIFTGHYKFTVYGQLLALGTEDMNIFFTAQDTITGWGGLRFINNNTNNQDQSRLVNCKIEYGKAQGDWPDNVGGGIFCQYSNILIDTCVVTMNYAVAGGGIYLNYSHAEINYTVLSKNHAQEFGGGIAMYQTCYPVLINNTIVDNEVDETGMIGGGIYADDTSSPFIVNTIIWGNTSYQIRLNFDGDSTVMYCDNEDFLFPGTGNICSNPLFQGGNREPYMITWDNFPVVDGTKSPCIDAGYPTSIDPDSTRRDIGAFPFSQKLLDPPDISISIVSNQIVLTCIDTNEGVGNRSFVVYSSDNPTGPFTIDQSGSFIGNVWVAPIPSIKKFYRVTIVENNRFISRSEGIPSLENLIEIHKQLQIIDTLK